MASQFAQRRFKPTGQRAQHARANGAENDGCKDGKKGGELLSDALKTALARPGKIYARKSEALAKARASSVAAPAILALHRLPSSKAILVTRKAVVNRLEASSQGLVLDQDQDPDISYSLRSTSPLGFYSALADGVDQLKVSVYLSFAASRYVSPLSRTRRS
jgi:hypothetical protein